MVKMFLIFSLLLSTSLAAAQESSENRFWHQDRQQIYGRSLMTPQERLDFRRQLWNLRTEDERERFRTAHREKMERRARDTGVPLPEKAPSHEWRGSVEPADEAPREDGLRRLTGGGGMQQRSDGLRRWPEAKKEEPANNFQGNRFSPRPSQ